MMYARFAGLTWQVKVEEEETAAAGTDCRGGSPCPPKDIVWITKDCIGSPGQGDHRGSPLQPFVGAGLRACPLKILFLKVKIRIAWRQVSPGRGDAPRHESAETLH